MKTTAPAPAKAPRTAPAKQPAAAAAVLTAQAWAEADQALAEALTAQARLDATLAALRRKLARSKDKALLAAADALDGEALLQAQALLRAAKARGISLFGEPGDQAKFDPKRHHVVKGDAPKAAPVRIVAPGALLGRTVLVPADVRIVKVAARPKPNPKPKPKPAARKAPA